MSEFRRDGFDDVATAAKKYLNVAVVRVVRMVVTEILIDATVGEIIIDVAVVERNIIIAVDVATRSETFGRDVRTSFFF